MKNPGPHLRQLPQAMDQKNPGPHLRQLPQAMDQRGEEPWASSEAAASGHGYTEVAWSSKNIMLNYTCMHAAVITSSSSFHACVLHFVLATWPPCGTNGDGCSAPSAKFGSRH